tara:strand:- start:1081 stop:2262 length:1182 start_codon:yes stop_codon:yes gene_type:complete
MISEQSGNVRFRGAFVILLTIAISGAFFTMIQPFIMALLLAAIGAGMLQPVFGWLCRLCRGREVPAAVLTVVLLFLLIVGPVTAFLGVVVSQAIEVSQSAIPWVKQYVSGEGNLMSAEAWVVEQFPSFKDYIPTRSQFLEGVGNAAEKTGNFLVFSVSKMTAGTAAFFMNLFVMLYALFFFLIKGDAILGKIFYYSPLSQDEEELLSDRFLSVTRATIKGSLVIGIVQGGLCGIAFAFAGITGAAFWGTVMAVLSVIPGVGVTLIWIPAAIYLAASGHMTNAILLAVWCGAFVGNLDNVLRPRLVGQDAKMPDLLILLGTLGGLFMFGAVGIIIGPIICSLFLAIWEIYGETFKSYLPPVSMNQKVDEEESGMDTDPSNEPDTEPLDEDETDS